MVPLRIDWIIIPSASRSWKKRNVLAGASKYAEPSGSTGTVPRIRLFSKFIQFIAGACWPWPSQAASDQFFLGGDSTTRTYRIEPGATSFMWVPT